VGTSRDETQTGGGLWRFLCDNSMSIALLLLFVACLGGQAAAGWPAYNAAQRTARLGPISFSRYLGTGDFLDGIFSNWQAAILQLAVLVAFSSVLRQRGAAHSRKTPAQTGRLTVKLRPRKTLGSWLYANSLSLALIGLFLLCFLLHALFGAWKYSEQQALLRAPGLGVVAYMGTAGFWSSALQCWEAEFGAIATYLICSIYLRQESSPESKHVEATDDDTGETNE